MDAFTNIDKLVGSIISGTGIFVTYAGIVSGIYLSIQSLRVSNWNNALTFALMTGGLFFLFSHISDGLPGPLAALGLTESHYYGDDDDPYSAEFY